MPQELIDVLDKFNLGTALSFIITVGTSLLGVRALFKREIKKIKEQGSQETLEKIEDENEKEKLSSYEEKIGIIEEEIDELGKELSSEAKDTEELYTRISEKLEQIDTLEKEVYEIKKQLISLVTSTLSINRSLILQVHHRCVINEKSIDLLSLQNVENLYRDYLAEVKDGGDEFIAKIMREIRDLPPRKD